MTDKILMFGSLLYPPAFICYPCSKCKSLKKKKKMTLAFKEKKMFYIIQLIQLS